MSTLSTTSPVTPAKRKYDFPTMTFETIPADPPRPGLSSLPFRERWTAMSVEVAQDGKARGFYVPAAYFVDERGAKPEKVNHGYIKQKLAEEWVKWVREAPGAKRDERFALVKSSRTGAEPGVEDMGHGVIAVLTAKAKVA